MADNDDKPPTKPVAHDEDTFAGALGLTFAGVMWVAAFAVVGLVVLYALVHGF